MKRKSKNLGKSKIEFQHFGGFFSVWMETNKNNNKRIVFDIDSGFGWILAEKEVTTRK